MTSTGNKDPGGVLRVKAWNRRNHCRNVLRVLGEYCRTWISSSRRVKGTTQDAPVTGLTLPLGTVIGVGTPVGSGSRFKVLLGVTGAGGTMPEGDLLVVEDLRGYLVLALSALLKVETGWALDDLLKVFA